MLKRILLTVCLGIFLAYGVNGQKTDQVILNNGTTIRGNITKIEPRGDVVIDDLAGNTWVFSMNDVKEITEIEESPRQKGSTPLESKVESAPYFPSGLVNMTTIGFLAGSQNSNYIAPFSVQNSIGYFTTFGAYAGILGGIEFLNINHIPVMIDLQYALRNSDVMPVIIARGGYAIPSKMNKEYYGTDYSYSGGVTGAIGMGLKIRTRSNFAWDISLLYRYMQINYSEENDWQNYPVTYTDIYNRLEFRLGFYLDVMNR